ncbi:hypothetical protein OGAPHI_002341 [Ogataea philodendri]|uniref:Uncharacterized protein n=1 Tax=Ogataea philodendri TaxID=1378263 RepID=A0A9P8PB26_9ASCO|nr:uncharacterized protein OGAPHI_002341 [Ogataea philodendri]KAH3668587.1 hypothetical protein OGAPHI_002341 [Ogataea philodendri]
MTVAIVILIAEVKLYRFPPNSDTLNVSTDIKFRTPPISFVSGSVSSSGLSGFSSPCFSSVFDPVPSFLLKALAYNSPTKTALNLASILLPSDWHLEIKIASERYPTSEMITQSQTRLVDEWSGSWIYSKICLRAIGGASSMSESTPL